MTTTPFDRVLRLAVFLGFPLLVAAALLGSPSLDGRPGVTSGTAWKLFFFHVPAALIGFASFAVALTSAAQYLRTRRPIYDQSAHAAIEVGVVLCGITLVTGMLWAYTEWSTPFPWDNAKVVLTLVLFLVYTAYLALRTQIGDPDRRARIASLYAVAAFVSVPLTWFAHKIWEPRPHPQVFEPDAPNEGIVTHGIMPIFTLALVVYLLAFLLFYRWRMKLLDAETRIDELIIAQEVPA